MDLFKKIQTLNAFWKKVIVFSALVVLGVLLFVLVGHNFQNRRVSLDTGKFLERLGLPKLQNELKTSFDEFEERGKELTEQLQEMESGLTDFATSSDSIQATSTE